jgi:hypothetical protein
MCIDMSKEEQFQKVADKDDLKEIKVEADGKQIILSMVEGKVCAIGGVTYSRCYIFLIYYGNSLKSYCLFVSTMSTCP